MNNKSRYYVRFLAGAYLVYQGYNLVKATLTDPDQPAIIFPIFGVVFLALGLAISGSALVALHRMNKEEKENGEGVQIPETAEEEENQAALPAQETEENSEESEESTTKEKGEKESECSL